MAGFWVQAQNCSALTRGCENARKVFPSGAEGARSILFLENRTCALYGSILFWKTVHVRCMHPDLDLNSGGDFLYT